jgi:hypothetical protein
LAAFLGDEQGIFQIETVLRLVFPPGRPTVGLFLATMANSSKFSISVWASSVNPLATALLRVIRRCSTRWRPSTTKQFQPQTVLQLRLRTNGLVG